MSVYKKKVEKVEELLRRAVCLMLFCKTVGQTADSYLCTILTPFLLALLTVMCALNFPPKCHQVAVSVSCRLRGVSGGGKLSAAKAATLKGMMSVCQAPLW